MRRRSFLQISATSLASAFVYPHQSILDTTLRKRHFTMSLNPGMIGVNTSLEELIDYAIDFRFEAVSPPTQEVSSLSSAARMTIQEKMKAHNLHWGSAGLPVDFRKDENTFKEGISILKKAAPGLELAGVTRMNTWLMPRHATLTYMENFKQHAERLREIGTILGDHNIRFGLEYVGPMTLRANHKYTFVHSLKELRELLAAIDRPNVGVVLDSFHWYTAHESAADILSLKNEDIVACDLNDVPVGREIDEQIDGQRMLPVATGMIDIKSFLNALIDIGYNGPVRAEPFNKELNALPNEAAVSATSTAMHQAFDLIS